MRQAIEGGLPTHAECGGLMLLSRSIQWRGRRAQMVGAIPGDGRQRLSNVRVEDVAGAALHLAMREDALGRAFNVADDSHPTLEEALGAEPRGPSTDRYRSWPPPELRT